VQTVQWADGKTEKLAGLIKELWITGTRGLSCTPRVLVIGCGTGKEALILAQQLQADVMGVDSQLPENNNRLFLRALLQHGVSLASGDATALAFPDESFDLIYSYHVLEHIPEYRLALQEMQRVLRKGGACLIGTPNRSRLLGYLGSKSIKSWREKLAWNYLDWQYRLKGRFKNEYGAHAGFTARELRAELRAFFRDVVDITAGYYKCVHPRHTGFIRFLIQSGLSKYTLPAIYFWGHKA
jgi:SAM-dependent methyltransferase